VWKVVKNKHQVFRFDHLSECEGGISLENAGDLQVASFLLYLTGEMRKMVFNRRLSFALLVLAFVFSFAFDVKAAVLAKGKDGIVVTDADLKRLEKEMGFTRVKDKKALVRYVLKIKLFAREALKEGLGKNLAGVKDEWERSKELYELYRKKLYDEYKVPEKVVKSYYLANWRKFVVKDSGVCLGGEEILKRPLRDLSEVRDIIVNKIKRAHLPIMEEKEFDRLMKKYEVKICGVDRC